MTDPNDMEDQQEGEMLPPELYEDWFAFCTECKRLGQLHSPMIDGAIKLGYDLAWQQLKPYMMAALPYYEAGLTNTTDAVELKGLAAYQEMANYGS